VLRRHFDQPAHEHAHHLADAGDVLDSVVNA
jgi:hypothetical protein